jgi:hypothetical protein
LLLYTDKGRAAFLKSIRCEIGKARRTQNLSTAKVYKETISQMIFFGWNPSIFVI